MYIYKVITLTTFQRFNIVNSKLFTFVLLTQIS